MGLALFYLQLQKKSNITEVIKNTANSYDPSQCVYSAGLGRELGREVIAEGSLGRVGTVGR